MSADIVETLERIGMSEPAARDKAALFVEVDRQLAAMTASEPLRWFVPGRIEVLGKHTDYAGGRSLLCAVERGFSVAAAPRADAVVRVIDVAKERHGEFAIAPDAGIPASGWTVYPAVVARRIARDFPGAARGADIVLASDLPSASGMSSSSALVVAIFAALSEVNRLPERVEYSGSIGSVEDLAGYLGCVENGQAFGALEGGSGVGTFGGSEDHTAILASEAGRLKQYAFCPVRLERTAILPADCCFVVAVSGVVADKIGAARDRYNRASLAARSIVAAWRTASGSDAATLAAALDASPDARDRIRAALEATVADAELRGLVDRLEQFWLESEVIVPQAVDALVRRDFARLGDLVDQSQAAAETRLGNQVPETIALTRQARALGAIAASAFGAGFGGSVWALVPTSDAAVFAERWRDRYSRTPRRADRAPEFFVTAAGPPLVRL